MVYQRLTKPSSLTSLHKKESNETAANIPRQTKSNSASLQEQEMPSYTPLAANWATNHNLMRSLNNAEVVQRQEEEIEPIQAKLTIGQVGDKYEQEADQTAQQVVNQINAPAPEQSTQDQAIQREEMPEDELQMKPASEIQREEMPEDELQMKQEAGVIQREEMPEEELQMKPEMQRKSDGGGMAATPDLEASIQQAKGGGQPLSENVRQPMEQAFGADFSSVNVHTDTHSDQLNQSIQAKAFTTGQDVFFRQGAYDPGSRGGQELIAHELTHVVQQNGGAVQRKTNKNLPNLQTKPADIQCAAGEITGVDWSTATKAFPSEGGGMGGVMIVTVGGTDYILKAINSGAATLFGEKVLNDIGGAQTTDSQLIPKNSTESADIHTMLKKYMTLESDKNKRERWDRNYPFFEKANYIALQENMKTGGGKEMEEITHSNAVELLHIGLLFNLGKAMAADTLIGNGDRFEAMNTGNAFVLDRAVIGAIDTTTILQNYTKFINESKTGGHIIYNLDIIDANAPKEWVQFITQCGIELGGKAPASNLNLLLARFDDWFEYNFKNQLISKIEEQSGKSAVPPAEKWDLAKHMIKRGFDAGMKLVDQALSGQEYKQLKSDFKDLEKEYGEDQNYDWQAFKARRAYIVTLRQGGSPQAAEQNAINVAEYMFVWKPKVKSITKANLDPKLKVVLEKPKKLSFSEKASRNIKGLGGLNRSETDKQSKELKEKARQGNVTNEDLEKIQGVAHRRDQKALYEVKFALFLANMEERAAGLKDLREEHTQMQEQAQGKTPQAELAKKKLDFIRLMYTSPDLTKIIETYIDIGNKWIETLDSKDKKDKNKLQKLGELIKSISG